MEKTKVKKDNSIIFRAGEDIKEALRDLREIHPNWNKSKIIREAIIRMRVQDSR